MRMRSILIVVAVGLILASVGGCKRTRDKWAAQGGMITSSAEDYIVVSQSGGQIMDVWKLRGAFVQSPENSDGWLFLDGTGNAIYVGGDVKTIRMRKDKSIWEDYHDYHMEHETQTYRELYGQK